MSLMDGYTFPRSKLSKVLLDSTKEPLVLVACGSYSPITLLHLRLFELARDHITAFQPQYELVGGYFSPVSDAYGKKGLASSNHRIKMCRLGTANSTWIDVDDWEARTPEYTRTAFVLDHFDEQINSKGGIMMSDGGYKRAHIMLLSGGDLIESFAVPKLWADEDVDRITRDYGCFVIERAGSNVNEFMMQNDIVWANRTNIHIVKQLVQNDISSTRIRLLRKRLQSIKYLVPDSVEEYVVRNRLWEN
ncbi:Nucleotidylyl transferase, partial [Gonapodya prolifera JEL478]